MKNPLVSLTAARRTEYGGYWCAVAWFLALVTVLQVPDWIAQSLSPAPTILFNIELLVSALVLLRLRILGWCLVALCYCVETMRLVSLNFHFIEPSDFVSAIRFAGLLSYRQYLTPSTVAAFSTVAAAGLAAAWIRVRCARHHRGPVVLVAMSIVLFDIANGSSPMFGRGDRFMIPINVAGSPLWALVDSVNRALIRQDGTPRQVGAASHSAIEKWHAAHPRDSVLVVLVESMGLPRSAAAREWLRRQIDTPRLRDRWELTHEIESFSGTTTYGELRVLCGIKASYTHMTRESGSRCLPALWRADGFDTYGFHGFSLKMFDRENWWPLIGLTPQSFAGDVPTHCNATFVGVCDDALLDRAFSASEQAKRFVYALTLDTHLPLSGSGKVQRDPALEEVCQTDNIPESACELIARTGRLLAGVAERAASLSSAPMIAIVGDHSPPFVETAARSAFDTSRVPLFILKPRRPDGSASTTP